MPSAEVDTSSRLKFLCSIAQKDEAMKLAVSFSKRGLRLSQDWLEDIFELLHSADDEIPLEDDDDDQTNIARFLRIQEHSDRTTPALLKELQSSPLLDGPLLLLQSRLELASTPGPDGHQPIPMGPSVMRPRAASASSVAEMPTVGNASEDPGGVGDATVTTGMNVGESNLCEMRFWRSLGNQPLTPTGSPGLLSLHAALHAQPLLWDAWVEFLGHVFATTPVTEFENSPSFAQLYLYGTNVPTMDNWDASSAYETFIKRWNLPDHFAAVFAFAEWLLGCGYYARSRVVFSLLAIRFSNSNFINCRITKSKEEEDQLAAMRSLPRYQKDDLKPLPSVVRSVWQSPGDWRHWHELSTAVEDRQLSPKLRLLCLRIALSFEECHDGLYGKFGSAVLDICDTTGFNDDATRTALLHDALHAFQRAHVLRPRRSHQQNIMRCFVLLERREEALKISRAVTTQHLRDCKAQSSLDCRKSDGGDGGEAPCYRVTVGRELELCQAFRKADEIVGDALEIILREVKINANADSNLKKFAIEAAFAIKHVYDETAAMKPSLELLASDVVGSLPVVKG